MQNHFIVLGIPYSVEPLKNSLGLILVYIYIIISMSCTKPYIKGFHCTLWSYHYHKYCVLQELSSDHTVLELLIQCHQVHMIVSTPLYQYLLQYLSIPSHHELSLTLFSSLLHCPQDEVCQLLQLHDVPSRVNSVSQQLYRHGYWMEAGAVLLRSHRTHPALVTTGNALFLLHKMFKS